MLAVKSCVVLEGIVDGILPAFGVCLAKVGTGGCSIRVKNSIRSGIVVIQRLRPAVTKGRSELQPFNNIHFAIKIILDLEPALKSYNQVIVSNGGKRINL